MTANLFGRPDDEVMQNSVEAVAELAVADDVAPPLEVWEWTAKPIREFVRVDYVIEHIIDYDLEEAYDPYGDVQNRLHEHAGDPEIVAAFNAAIDKLLEHAVGWRWADEHVATWSVAWDPAVDPPVFTMERSETCRKTSAHT